MVTVTSNTGSDQPKEDRRHSVVKAVVLAAAGFGSTTVTMLMISGQWQIEGETTRYGITVAAVVMALSFFVAAVYIWPRR
jgi:hypothetical protein